MGPDYSVLSLEVLHYWIVHNIYCIACIVYIIIVLYRLHVVQYYIT